MPFYTAPKSEPRLVVELSLPDPTLWQCAVQNPVTKEWFLSQARPKDGGEDTLYHRFTPNGVYLDYCTVIDGGHGTAYGLSDTNIIWATLDGDIVTFQYTPGGVFTRENTNQMKVFNKNWAQISFSPTRKYAVIREQTKQFDTFYRRAKADILEGKDKVLGKPVVIKRDGRPLQGFTMRDWNLYRYMGYEDTRVEKYDIKTGKKIGEWNNSYLIGEGNVINREGEGMAQTTGGSLIGMKVWIDNNRNGKHDEKVLRVFKTDF